MAGHFLLFLSMQDLQALFEGIGLNHHESTVYMHLLAHGEMAASKIGVATRIPRSTVRGVLDKLCERGLVTKIYKRNTQYYSCKPASAWIKYLKHEAEQTEKHLAEIQAALPMISALHGRSNIVPKVRVFEGPEQVKEAFNSTLYVEGLKEICVLTSYEFLKHPLLRKNDDAFYIPLRVKKGITLRSLVGKTDLKDKYKKSEPLELRQRRFLPKDYQFPGTFYIYGDCVLYFSASDDEYIAIIVESALMARTMKALFEFMWGQCK